MSYCRYSLRILSLLCIGMMFFSTQASLSGRKIKETSQTKRQNDLSSMIDQSLEEEMKMYPFIKSKTALPAGEITSIRVGKEAITVFSSQNKYMSTTEQQEVMFDQVDFFSKYPELKNVELNDIELTDEKLENLQKFLPRKLTGLLICNCDIPKARTPRLVDIIKSRDNLVSFSLFFPRCSSKKSAMLLEALDGYENMKYLNLTFGHVSGKGCKMIAALLKNSKGTIKGLTIGIGQVQDDENNEGLHELIETINELPNLEQFEISFLELPEELVHSLFEGVGHLGNLERLRLFIGNHADYDQVGFFNNMENLRDSIASLEHLRSLDISLMELPGSIMQLLGQAVASLPELRNLNISYNKLDEKGAEIFSASMKQHGKIEVFTANGCDITAVAFGNLCRYLGGTDLRQMSLANNKIADGAKNLPIEQIPLEIVDFSNNDMSYEDVRDFLNKVKPGTTLRILNFGNNSKIDELENVERTIEHDRVEQWRLNFEDEKSPALFGL